MAKSQTTKGKIVRKFGENIFGNAQSTFENWDAGITQEEE